MSDPSLIQGLRLRGGFTIVRLEVAGEPLVDAVGRRAVAKTKIIGREFHLMVVSGLSDAEWSVTVYHEILEAITVACSEAPAQVQDFNEADFERAGYDAHGQFGPVSREGLNRMLQFYGFPEE